MSGGIPPFLLYAVMTPTGTNVHFFIRKLYCITGNKLQFHTRCTQGTQEVQQQAISHETLTKRFTVMANWRELPFATTQEAGEINGCNYLLKPETYFITISFNIQEFCSAHNAFMCLAWISEQTAIISLYSINLTVFITEAERFLRGTNWSLNQTATVSSLKG
jgi:hypothetical protein